MIIGIEYSKVKFLSNKKFDNTVKEPNTYKYIHTLHMVGK